MDRRSIAERDESKIDTLPDWRNAMQRRYIEKVKIPEFFNKYQGEVFSEGLLYLLQQHLGDYKRRQGCDYYTLDARWSDSSQSGISILYNDQVICTLTD